LFFRGKKGLKSGCPRAKDHRDEGHYKKYWGRKQGVWNESGGFRVGKRGESSGRGGNYPVGVLGDIKT